MPACSIALLPHGILSFLPGLLEGKEATSQSRAHSASSLWPEISYWGTCIQLYKPPSWLVEVPSFLMQLPFGFVSVAQQSDFAFPNELFSCLYALRNSGSGQPVSFSSTQCCLGVEEVSYCSDEMCLQLHLFFSWVLQQMPGLQRLVFDKKSKIILSTSIWYLWVCHCAWLPSLKERRTERRITPFFFLSRATMWWVVWILVTAAQYNGVSEHRRAPTAGQPLVWTQLQPGSRD